MYTLSDANYTKEKLLEELLTDMGPGMLKKYSDSASAFTKICNGMGEYHVNRDMHNIAIRFYQRSAAYDNIEAQEKLAQYYKDGIHISIDYSIVMQYSLDAAMQKSQVAYLNIAELFERGNGTSINKQMAMEWYYKTDEHQEQAKTLLKNNALTYTDIEKNKSVDDLIKETRELVLIEQLKNLDEPDVFPADQNEIALIDRTHQLRQSFQWLETLLEKKKKRQKSLEEQNSTLRMEIIQEQLENQQNTVKLNQKNKALKKKIKHHQKQIEQGTKQRDQSSDSQHENDINYDTE